MSKDKMMDMYASVLAGAKAKTFVDQIFQKFDSDNSGSIDFKVSFLLVYVNKKTFVFKFPLIINFLVWQEFMLATNMTGAENSEEKLRWAFKMLA